MVEAGIGQVRQNGRLPFHFLYVIFAELAQAEGVSISNHRRREDFGDSEQSHLGGVAAGAGGGVVDSFVYGLEALSEGFRQARESLSCIQMIVDGAECRSFGRLEQSGNLVCTRSSAG
jgi:hypothetical protein